MQLPWLTGKIVRIEDETHLTKRFWIQVPSVDSFDFIPGQFVTLDLPIHEQKNKRWRSYSIASRPDGTNVFELIVVKLEGGQGSSYLFNNVSVDDEIIFRGPQGVFTLPEDIDTDLFFICTGTGIAPFRSMIQHIYHYNISHHNIYLIFGCRTLQDVLYEAEIHALQKLHDSLLYIPVFSREDKVSHPQLQTGYVHPVYENICIEKKNAHPENKLSPARFYLCGWKDMIDEAKNRLLALGYDKKDIHLELYG